MKITIVTLFPNIIESYFNESIIKKALDKGLYTLDIVNLRDYSNDKHKHVDDTPYSQTTGMLIKVDVVKRCLDALDYKNCNVIATTPVGNLYKQQDACNLCLDNKDIIILCGHYEGFDNRVYNYCNYRYCIGDFVLSGGEIAAMAIADSIIRLIPGTLSADSLKDESFTTNLLEYDQYTRPYEFEGNTVPDVLVNGNHALIKKFQQESSLANTLKYRPDLIKKDNNK